MPQMMPMNWLILPLMFLICYMLLMSLLFSFKFPLTPSLMLKSNLNQKMIWKW